MIIGQRTGVYYCNNKMLQEIWQ
uniref:Uncharacterized protein n=1 Tax=Anguilla anguilla TaxID=7936 RepID=A0A0E9RLP5_ANGAN